MNLYIAYFLTRTLTATAPAKSRMMIRDLAGGNAFSNDIF